MVSNGKVRSDAGEYRAFILPQSLEGHLLQTSSLVHYMLRFNLEKTWSSSGRNQRKWTYWLLRGGVCLRRWLLAAVERQRTFRHRVDTVTCFKAVRHHSRLQAQLRTVCGPVSIPTTRLGSRTGPKYGPVIFCTKREHTEHNMTFLSTYVIFLVSAAYIITCVLYSVTCDFYSFLKDTQKHLHVETSVRESGTVCAFSAVLNDWLHIIFNNTPGLTFTHV